LSALAANYALLAELVDRRVGSQHLHAVVDRELDPVLVDQELVPVVALRLALDDDGRIAEPRQRLGGLAACVGLLDRAGERALAAHREAAARGGARPGEETRGDHQLVRGAEWMTQRVNFLGHDHGGHAAAAEARECPDRLGCHLRAGHRRLARAGYARHRQRAGEAVG